MKLITVHDDNFPAVSLNTVNNVSMNDDLIRKNEDVFSRELGTLPGTVHLQVDEMAQPVIMPPHRIPTALKDIFKDGLNRLEDLGVLSKADEPTARSVALSWQPRGLVN